jgi:hypothetical protein
MEERLMALMPPFAPIVILIFLGSILSGMLAAAVLVYGVALKQPAVRRWAAIAIAVIPAGYATLLLGASLTSQDRVLAAGAKKYFCEIDCHLAYSVDRIEQAAALGSERPAGAFYVIALKTWFDESTISPRRPKDALLTPNPRRIYVEDASGRRFPPSDAGLRALEATGVKSTPISQALIPGESYVTELVFDLPAGVREPRLFVGDDDPVSSLLIGHEQSPLHRKIWFRI